MRHEELNKANSSALETKHVKGGDHQTLKNHHICGRVEWTSVTNTTYAES